MTIISSSTAIPIESHFRISAGPGAGKTYWLINHIRTVLRQSERIGKVRKIACITYTNVATETIQERLGDASDQVEIGTIHSFLYANVIKPYIKFLENDLGLNSLKTDGHDDHYFSYKKTKSWLESHVNIAKLKNPYTPKQLLDLDYNKEGLTRWLNTFHYTFTPSGELEPACKRGEAYYIDKQSNKRKNLNGKCLDELEEGLLDYKKIFWSEGTLHHEDVLFLSYHLIRNYSFVRDILRARFAYIFIDEFQDTSPIQTNIIKLIAEKETIVGIIGDKAQSIYGFQGAAPQDFTDFRLDGLTDFVISDNRRSTNQIISLLNHIRKDMVQNCVAEVNGEQPKILVGEVSLAYRFARSLSGEEDVCSLSFSNEAVSKMKCLIECADFIPDLEKLLLSIDPPQSSNSFRSRVVLACLTALELASLGLIGDAIKEMEKNLRYISDIEARRKKALRLVRLLLNMRSQFWESALSDFIKVVKENVDDNISSLRSGKPKEFYDNTTYSQMARSLNSLNEFGLIRTIHKSKGAEFNNVLLVLNKEDDLEFIIRPKLEKETHRVYYVAASRAKKSLLISVPNIEEKSLSLLTSLESICEVIHLESLSRYSDGQPARSS